MYSSKEGSKINQQYSDVNVEEKEIVIEKVDPLLLYGVSDQNIKLIEKNFPVQLIVRGNKIKIIGAISDISAVENIFSELIFIANRNHTLTPGDVETVIHIVKANNQSVRESDDNVAVHSSDDLEEVVLFTRRGFVKPRTPGQTEILSAIKDNDILVVIGPAGTGKTFLAVAIAVAALKNKQIGKIVLARPAVEAGENLGFLPGDYKEKIDPFLRPLYDALEEMLPKELLKKYLEQGIIEVIPLAYMRGRTLNNAFVILDEAQNATQMQMKMCLTRLGVNSNAIINGDITQIDLPSSDHSGLVEIQNVLKGIEGIKFVYLDKKDVVRHRLVRDIINAYDVHRNNK